MLSAVPVALPSDLGQSASVFDERGTRAPFFFCFRPGPSALETKLKKKRKKEKEKRTKQKKNKESQPITKLDCGTA